MRLPSTQAAGALAFAVLALSALPARAFQAPPPAASPAAASPAPASPAPSPTATPTPLPIDESLPPADENVQAALAKSSRHHEWADVKVPDTGRTIRTFVVYPERKDKAPAVIVIHENSGLTDWARGVADQLAEDGFIALAPDLLSGKGPGGGNTDALPSRDEAIRVLRTLTDAETMAALDAVRGYALKLPAASGKLATMGFCWGGGRSFAYAAHQPALDAAIVYYGSPPEESALANVKAVVLGLYGGDDARITATVLPTSEQAKKLGQTYEYEIYEGAGHGFLRGQAQRGGANYQATRKAWPRSLMFLRARLK